MVMKTMLAIHDLSCHSKSSLSVVLPALSALGIDYSILPTALLSTQTDGFEGYEYIDLTQFMLDTLKHWKKLDLTLDSLYSGFLGSEQQIDIVLAALEWQEAKSKDFLTVVDPVLGDNGEPYAPVSESLIKKMQELVRHARVITPNVTEAAFLLQEPYNPALSVEEAKRWAIRLSQLGPQKVAITSVMDSIWGGVIAYDSATNETAVIKEIYTSISYPGCGDLFASILAGQLVRGVAFFEATRFASNLVSKAVRLSYEGGRERTLGVSVETIIPLLVERSQWY